MVSYPRNHSTLYASPPGRPVHSNTNISGNYSAMLQLLFIHIYPSLSIARSSSIQLSELRQCGMNEIAQASKWLQEDSNCSTSNSSLLARGISSTTVPWQINPSSPARGGSSTTVPWQINPSSLARGGSSTTVPLADQPILISQGW